MESRDKSNTESGPWGQSLLSLRAYGANLEKCTFKTHCSLRALRVYSFGPSSSKTHRICTNSTRRPLTHVTYFRSSADVGQRWESGLDPLPALPL